MESAGKETVLSENEVLELILVKYINTPIYGLNLKISFNSNIVLESMNLGIKPTTTTLYKLKSTIDKNIHVENTLNLVSYLINCKNYSHPFSVLIFHETENDLGHDL